MWKQGADPERFPHILCTQLDFIEPSGSLGLKGTAEGRH